MKSDLILAKIESLQHCIKRIKEKAPDDIQALRSNYDLQDILVINLERAIQNCVDIGVHILSALGERAPTSMAETFIKLNQLAVIDDVLSVRLSKAVGFRNIAVHEYESLNWEIVFSIVTKGSIDFKDYMKAILRFIESTDD